MLYILLIFTMGSVKHQKGDIWVGWDDGYVHHEGLENVNHSGIDIGNYKLVYNWYDTVVISSRKYRGVNYDNVWYWYDAYSSEGSPTPPGRLDIHYVSGYPGHYFHPNAIVNWTTNQLGKPYNTSLNNFAQDNSFYCHQLCYRAFRNVAGIYLNDTFYIPFPLQGDMIEALDLAYSGP